LNVTSETDIPGFEEQGYAWARNALDTAAIEALLAVTEVFSTQQAYGVRHVCDKLPQIRALLQSAPIRRIIEPLLGEQAFLVRSVFFDKNPQANWHLPWHQDTAIAVKQKVALPGFGVWSVKDGVDYVEPPEAILSSMVTLRIHLDDATPDNGVLRVMPGSQRWGRLPSAQILALLDTQAVFECTAVPGDVLIMQPLLCHASRKARQSGSVLSLHRRVIHLEYANQALPDPLQWYEA